LTFMMSSIRMALTNPVRQETPLGWKLHRSSAGLKHTLRRMK
jgi:hypothetical protein